MSDLPPAVASWRDQIERLSEHASPCRYLTPTRWAAMRANALPPAATQIPPVPPGLPYTIQVWDRIGGKLELHLTTIYPLTVAIAAFEVACLEWPTNEVTLRDRARIVLKRELAPRGANGASPA